MVDNRVIKNHMDEIHTFYDLIKISTKVYADSLVVKQKKKKDVLEVTYAQMWNDVCHVANQINKHLKAKDNDTSKKHHIGIIASSNYDWIVTFYSIILSGNIAVPIDKQSNCITDFIKLADLSAVYIDSSVKKIDAFKDELDENIIIFSNTDLENDDRYKDLNYKFNIHDFCNKSSDDNLLDTSDIKPDDTAVLIFTSGTTGNNKGVLLSHQNIIDNTKCCIHIINDELKEKDTSIAVLPPTHMLQITCHFMSVFFLGTTMCFGENMKYLSQDMLLFKPKSLVLVPLIVENMYAKVMYQAKKSVGEKKLNTIIKISNCLRKIGIDMRKVFFKKILDSFGGNLSVVICGGAAINNEVVKGFDNFGISIYNGYGITECAPLITGSSKGHVRDNSVGPKAPNDFYEIKLIDGEICVKGSIVFKGYYKDQEATDKVIIDGWFHTGDIGEVDKDGFYYITGRKKNLIVLSDGNNVSPEELEAYFADFDYIASMFVAESHKDGHSCIKAHIYPNYQHPEYLDKTISEDELTDKINAFIKEVNVKLPAYKRINDVEFYKEDFEKTALGKIRRFKYTE